jgi:hypothetical protein
MAVARRQSSLQLAAGPFFCSQKMSLSRETAEPSIARARAAEALGRPHRDRDEFSVLVEAQVALVRNRDGVPRATAAHDERDEEHGDASGARHPTRIVAEALRNPA